MSDYFFETSIRKIKEASENNKLVIFVGAGISANSGVPTWNELIKEMAKELGEFDVDKHPDLFMKIPQYYFNERGEKEYYEKLNEIFLKKKYYTNPIHRQIFNLNPTHIITTNYDTLLEEAAIQEGKFFQTVKHDLDLPYNNFNKTLIKMHGDFENRNIVLKEDDYLNYSSNFALIENYIRSLIATNTVLFIGYSVNDPNFNLIFQWVKTILGSHFQPAYLIESSKEYSRIEHSYYKNRGINILYYNEISNICTNNVFDKNNWRGNRLYDVITYFNSFDTMLRMNDVEEIYEKVSCFEELKFIMPEQIVKSLNLNKVGYDLFGERTLSILGEENALSSLFSNVEQNKDHWLFEKIIKIFVKANIHGISRGNEIIYSFDTKNSYLNEIINSTIERDSLIADIDVNSFTSTIGENDYFSMLEQANVYFEYNYFLEAYKCYKNISLKSYQDKEYLIYYLSEFNRKHVGKYLNNLHLDKIDKSIELEIEELNLDDIYFNLPYKERKSLNFLKELQNFNLIYKVQNKLNKEVKTLKKTKRTIETGGISINSSLNKNFHIINNIWLFIKANYLSIEKYVEIQNLYLSFIDGIFASYSTQPNANPKGLFNDLSFNKVEKLDLFEVYIMIIKLKTKELEGLIIEYNVIEIKVKTKAYEYMIKVLDKVVDNVLNNNNVEKSASYLYNLIILFSKIELGVEQANYIAKKLVLLINRNTYINEFKYINRFIVSIANKKLIYQKTVKEYLENYLNAFLQNNRVIEFDSNGLYRNLTNIYSNYDENPIDKVILSSYMDMIKKSYYDKNDNVPLYSILGELIVPIISTLSGEFCKLVTDIIQELVDEIKTTEKPLSYNEIYFYYTVLINDVITTEKSINRKIVEDIVSKINQQDKKVNAYPNPIEERLNILTDLYRRGQIKKKEIEEYVKSFDGYSEYFDLVFNMDGIKLTDIELLLYLKEDEIDNVMENDMTKENIYKLFEDKYISQIHEKYKNIFQKLYTKRYK